MTLDEARTILRGKRGSVDRLGPEFVQHAYAAEVIGNAARAAMDRTTHTTDAIPLADVMQWEDFAREAETMDFSSWFTHDAAIMPEAGSRSPGGVTTGSRGGGAVGPTIAVRLPGPASGYSIGTDGDGSTVVWRHSNVSGEGDTMQTEVADRARRARTEYLSSVSRVQLQKINAANRAFWSKQH